MLQSLRTASLPRAARVALGFGLALAWALPSFSQEILGPRGPRVEVDRDCALSPIPFEVDGETFVAWFRSGGDTGIWARRGARLDELGSAVELVDENPTSIQVAARPGGFVLAWVGDDWPDPDVAFQRFGADLAPEGPPVVVGTSSIFISPALAVDAAGNVTVAWSDGEDGLKVRRYSNAGLPTTPEIAISAPLGVDGVWLAAGEGGFLVAWSEYLVLPASTTHYRARAYSPAGTPLGPMTELGEGTNPAFIRSTFQIAAVDGGYLVVRTGGLARLLGEDGTPLGPETALGIAAVANGIRMDSGPEGVWLGWYTQTAIYASLVDPSALTAQPPTLLASLDPPDFPILSAIEARESGFIAGWHVGFSSIILPSPPCDWGEFAYSQEFGPSRGVIDVPTLSKTGLALCALAFAIAGILMRRAF